MRHGQLEEVENETEDASPAARQENVAQFCLGCFVRPGKHADLFLIGQPSNGSSLPCSGMTVMAAGGGFVVSPLSVVLVGPWAPSLVASVIIWPAFVNVGGLPYPPAE